MSTKLAKVVADFQTSLATAIAVSGTSCSIQSATDDDGVALASGRYLITVDAENSSKEHFSCDLSGTSLTNLVSISRQGSETSGAARAHRVGASVVMTDFAHIKYLKDLLDGTTDLNASTPLKYDGTATISNDAHLATKKYVDDTAVSGAPDATASTKGIVKMSYAPSSATNPIAVGDNDPRVPTQDENNAIAGESGTAVSSTNKLVDRTTITGIISAWGGSSAPTGWLLCDGTAVSRTTYANLFTILGTTYGVGNGSSTFNLPNLKGKVVVGLDASQTEFDALAETGGTKTHTLTIAEMPAHTHPSSTYSTTGAGAVNASTFLSAGNGPVSGSVPSQGGDGAHNNLQPYIVLNYIIKH